jgi:hypothetical protein
MITKTKINHQQSTMPFATSPQKMVVLSRTFLPAEAGIIIATQTITNSTPFFLGINN